MAIEEVMNSEQLRSGGEKVRRQFEEAGDRLKSSAADSWEDISDLIRKHPGKAIGFGILAGMAIGGLMSGASSRRPARDQIRDLAGTGIDAWERVKDGFAEAVASLKDALDDAAGKFK